MENTQTDTIELNDIDKAALEEVRKSEEFYKPLTEPESVEIKENQDNITTTTEGETTTDDNTDTNTDKQTAEETQTSENEEVRYAGKYKSVETLENGINHLRDKLGITDGVDLSYMTTEGKEKYYQSLVPKLSTKDNLQINEDKSTNTQPQHNRKEDIDTLISQFQRDGEVSEDMYELLNDRYSLDKDFVNSYVDGVKSKMELESNRLETEVIGQVGTREDYVKLLSWAEQNVDPEDVSSFNSIMESGNLAAMKFAVKSINTMYKNTNQYKNTTVIDGDSTSEGFTGSYNDYDQYLADISKPEYETDSRYRDKVYKKLKNSKNMNR